MTTFIYAPDIFNGDAVGNHCFGVARAARRLGLTAEVHAQRYDKSTSAVSHVDALLERIRPDDTLFVSYSIYDEYLDKLLALPCRKIGYFHGITDPALLREFEPRTADFCQAGVDQMPALRAFDQLIANSRRTAAELAARTQRESIAAIPPVFGDMPAFAHTRPERHFDGGRYMMLSVGRVVPHKKIEDTLRLVGECRASGLDARLTVVGTMPNHDYAKYLFNLGRSLKILDYVDFTGMLDDTDLFQCYDRADALLSMSLHEGFGVPALEAMCFGLPVFARAGTAIDEVSEGVGTLFDDDVRRSAQQVVALVNQPSWLREQATAGRNRANALLQQTADGVWQSVFNS